MSDKIDDGGAAFPTLDHNGHALVCREFGMTLLDYYAGKALEGDMANSEGGLYRDDVDDARLLVRAQLMFRIAAAMIAARKPADG